MPINPNIILQGRMADVGGAIQQGVQTGGMFQQLQQQRAEAPLRQQMLEQQVTQQSNAIADAEEKRQLVSGFNAYTESNSLVNAGDIGGALESLISRKSQLDAAGKDSSHTDAALQLLGAMEQGGEIGEQAKRRWDALGQNLQGQMQLRGLAPKAVAATAGERERASLLRSLKGSLDDNGNFDPSKANAAQKSAAIDLGLIPSAGGTARERIARDPTLTESVARSESEIEARKETKKLGAQLKLKPQVESAVVRAVGQAREGIKQAGEARSNKLAFSVYESAISNLVTSLGGTVTGPGAGFIPAMTADAQIANGAVAMMAPVLKQLFRGAGEGTFTDQDQKMLLALIPDRNTHQEARVSQLNAIDAMVRAKLRIQPEEQPQQAQPNTMTINGVTVTRVQ